MNVDSVIEKVLEEHRTITRLLEQILGTFAQKSGASRVNEWKDLRPKLADLHVHLKEHFRLEEEGGFLAPVLEVLPTASSSVDALMGEHRLLLEQVNTLLHRIDASTRENQLDASLVLQIQQFAEMLKKHERSEDSLIQKVYAEDIGTDD